MWSMSVLIVETTTADVTALRMTSVSSSVPAPECAVAGLVNWLG
jgi:hypothetical protein